MAKHKVPRTGRKLIEARRFAFNQGAVNAGMFRRLANTYNFLQAYRGKCFLSFSENYVNTRLFANEPPNTGSGTTKMRHFRVHTSPQTSQLKFNLGVITVGLDDDLDSMTNPRARVRVLEPDEAETASQLTGAIGLPAQVEEEGPLPDSIAWGTVSIDVSPETEYIGWVELIDGQRIIAGTGYEWSGSPVDDTSDGISDPTAYVDEGPILTSDFEDLVHANNTLPDAQGAPLICYSGPDDARALEVDAAGPVNIFDTSISSVSDTSPGFRVDLTNKGDINGEVKCRFAVRASLQVAGTGTNEIELVDQTDGTVASVSGWVGDTSDETNDYHWKTADITLEAKEYKFDIHGTEGEAKILKIFAAYLYPHPHT